MSERETCPTHNTPLVDGRCLLCAMVTLETRDQGFGSMRDAVMHSLSVMDHQSIPDRIPLKDDRGVDIGHVTIKRADDGTLTARCVLTDHEGFEAAVERCTFKPRAAGYTIV